MKLNDFSNIFLALSLFVMFGSLAVYLLDDMEDRQQFSAPQPENRTESAPKFPTTIDLSFDSVKMQSFPGISTTLSTDIDNARRIYFCPDNERFFLLKLAYYPGDENPFIYMFGARGVPLLMQERNEILQSEQSLSNWMSVQLLALKQQKLRNRSRLIDEL